MQDIQFICLNSDELKKDLDWWEIYNESFPPEEKESEAVILKALGLGVGLAFAARKNGKTIAISSTQRLKEPEACFLIYLATHKSFRGLGLGADFVKWVWKTTAPQGPMISEIEPILPELTQNLDTNKLTLRKRRIAFFNRMGAKLLNIAYIQPPLFENQSVPMSLMLTLDGASEKSDEASEIELSMQLRHAIYWQKYRMINQIDAETIRSLEEACQNHPL